MLMVRILARLLERGERRLDALTLLFVDEARQHLDELRVLGARVNVLPAVGLEECGLDPVRSCPWTRNSMWRGRIREVGLAGKSPAPPTEASDAAVAGVRIR